MFRIHVFHSLSSKLLVYDHFCHPLFYILLLSIRSKAIQNTCSQGQNRMKTFLKYLAVFIVLLLLAVLIFLFRSTASKKIQTSNDEPVVDAVLVGGGIMSATLGTYLTELENPHVRTTRSSCSRKLEWL